MSGATVSGIISGMDTSTIIAKLMDVEKQPVTRLQDQENTLNSKVSAWQDMNTRILAFKDKVDTLANSSTYDAKTINTDDDSLLTGTASTSAQTGTYYIKVNQLARANQIKSEGFSDINQTQIGTGTISISTGTATPKVITIDSNNNTLSGLKDAINKAGAGVNASIVNDGSGANPYRLVLTSNTSGSGGAITVNSSLSGGTAPQFSTMQAAQDAKITMGEGAGAVTVTRSKNSISDLIPGVTLNLASADTTKTVTVTIANDTSALSQSVYDFTNQYNNLVDSINSQFKYDSTANTGGTLFADPDLQSIQMTLNDKMFSPIAGLDGMAVLSEIGISTDTDGQLAVDSSKLNDALANNLEGVKKLFSTMGDTSNSNIKFVASGTLTQPSGADGYDVNITSNATLARLTSGTALPSALSQDESLTVNGQVISLTAGMTPNQIVAKLNENSSTTGVTASLTDASGQGTDNYLTLTRTSYGSGQMINVSTDATGPGSTGLTNTTNRVTAGVQQTNALDADETLTINGVDIALTKGMSRQAVASAINAQAASTGVMASWTGANGTGGGLYLSLSSAGMAHNITAVSNKSNQSGNTTGFGNVAVTETSAAGESGHGVGIIGTASGDDGTDVVGTINGEACKGKGQILTGNSGNRTTDGLVVTVSGDTVGDCGTVSVTKGLASILSDFLSSVTDSSTGLIDTTEKGLKDEITDIDKQISELNDRVTAKQDEYTTKFADMESALGKLKDESDYITQQAEQLSANWGGSKK